MHEKPDISAECNPEETRHFSTTKCMRNQIYRHNVIQKKTDFPAQSITGENRYINITLYTSNYMYIFQHNVIHEKPYILA